MQHQLNLIRILVTVTLNPENHHQFQLKDECTKIAGLTLIREKLYTAIRENVFGTAHTSVIMRQIRQVQSDCIHLLNVLYSYKTTKTEVLQLQEAATICLEDILKYIEKDHVHLFNFQASVPHAHHQAAMDVLSDNYKILKMVLKKYRVPLELVKLLTGCLGEVIESPAYSYKALFYMQLLISRLIKLEAPDGNYTRALREQLVYLKFNHLVFTGGYVHMIRKEVSELYDTREQYEFLCKQLKWLKALQESSADGYDNGRPGLRMLLMEYVAAEMEFLKRGRLLNENPEETGVVAGKSYRIKLAISASLLAYLIRLLVDIEVTVAKPRSLLMDFVARHFQTIGIGSECLSAGSLETKYKQVTQNTKIAACALLRRMLKRAEQQIA